ncbi:hypothetical protein M3Y99_00308000 [Aphelenchoides fujianensis]|nr:hypothetical protein M3Y99_00308000 [Aphelenchoides fujianensis]
MSERATDGTPDPSPVKEVSPTIGNVQPIVAIPTPPLNEQKSTEPSMFTIAKLLDSARPITERLSISEANSLMEMRSKIDERLRRSESSEMRPASGNPAFSFMNQLYIWSTLKMMESGESGPQIGFSSSSPPKITGRPAGAESAT